MVVVPAQGLGIGAPHDIRRRKDRPPVQFIVVLSVVELLLDPAAHLEAKIGRNRHITCIEEAVDIAPKQKPVPRLMLAAVAIGAYM
jgi:hypothetical protein